MKRTTALEKIKRDPDFVWDLVIIGGGATGLGAAVDGASRGYNVLLVEREDFASGTSSRSTKLVHGGVRYLKQGNIKLVYDALHERGYLLKNAPHIVHTLPFIIPCYRWWEKPFYGIGLFLYDLLAGKMGIGRTKMLSKEITQACLETITFENLEGGVQYIDGQFDDTRLAIDLAQTATQHGAIVINYTQANGFLKSNGRISGIIAKDLLSGETLQIKARGVINATGVFCDEVRHLENPTTPGLVTPSQGAHLVLPGEFLSKDTALMIPATSDGRVLFAIPWHGHVILGTTDTPRPDIVLEPRPFEEEIEFLLSYAAQYLTKAPTKADVLSAFAGLRPLVSKKGASSTAALSRDHVIVTSPLGLITITGGKWTTYRAMAEDVIDKATEIAHLNKFSCRTKQLQIYGANGEHKAALEALIAEDPSLEETLLEGLPYRWADIIHAIRHEMAQTVTDCLARRTRCLFLNARQSPTVADRVGKILAKELGKEAAWGATLAEEYKTLAKQYCL